MKIGDVVTVARDILCIVIGLAGIAHQELVGPVKTELLLVYTTMLGVPGAVGLWQLRGNRSGGTDTTGSSQSAPVRQSQQG